MTVSLRNPADVVNAALVAMGWRNQVGSLWDGSDAAKLALAVYGQTRDALLRGSDWGFAQYTAPLTVLKIAPANYVPPTSWNPTDYPPLPWAFEYAYPADCLQVRSLRATPLFVGPDFDPTPVLFQIANDDVDDVSKRTILANLQDAIATYTRRVTDPSLFSVDFADVLVEKLQETLGAALASLQESQMGALKAARDLDEAKKEQG